MDLSGKLPLTFIDDDWKGQPHSTYTVVGELLKTAQIWGVFFIINKQCYLVKKKRRRRQSHLPAADKKQQENVKNNLKAFICMHCTCTYKLLDL